MIPTRAFPLALALALGLGLAADGEVPDVPPDNLPAELPAGAPRGLEAAGYEPPAVSEAVVALGRRLFFDPLLSVDHTLACASCHRPDHGFADPRPLSVGVRGQTTTRNAPTLFNRALGQAFMWDGRFSTLEEQVLQPIQNPLEMDLSLERALERLARDELYNPAFERAFGRAPDAQGLAASLAAFVRRLWTGDSPLDRFRAGQVTALTPAEKAGLWLYESRGGCWRCHPAPNFSDESFHDTGVGAADGVPAAGRFAVTGDERDRGRFKTPTLRGLASSGPFMHDGSQATLEEVVEHYRKGGNANHNLDPQIAPLELSDRDAANLVAFLGALSRRSPDSSR